MIELEGRLRAIGECLPFEPLKGVTHHFRHTSRTRPGTMVNWWLSTSRAQVQGFNMREVGSASLGKSLLCPMTALQMSDKQLASSLQKGRRGVASSAREQLRQSDDVSLQNDSQERIRAPQPVQDVMSFTGLGVLEAANLLEAYGGSVGAAVSCHDQELNSLKTDVAVGAATAQAAIFSVSQGGPRIVPGEVAGIIQGAKVEAAADVAYSTAPSTVTADAAGGLTGALPIRINEMEQMESLAVAALADFRNGEITASSIAHVEQLSAQLVASTLRFGKTISILQDASVQALEYQAQRDASEAQRVRFGE